jgi:hypothetical protein
VTLRFEIGNERVDGGIAIAGPWHVMEVGADSRLRSALPELLYSGVGGSSRPW